MGERKLNMNIPLMSVRRFSTASKGESGKTSEKPLPTRRHTLPTSRAEVKMDQATEPVAVPFHWEQIPGKCKNNSGPDHRFPGKASVIPRLPPGRSLSATKTPVQEPGPAGRNKIWPSNKAHSFNENAIKHDCSKEEKDILAGFDVKEDEDIYSDVLDELSQAESLSMNCSISGVSGFDTSTMNQKGTFSSDPQIRDFMMNRFLPAAKAMASQPPQNASRKQSAAVVRQTEAPMQSLVEKRPLLAQNPSNMLLRYGDYIEKQDKSDDEGEEESDTANDNSAKGCGLVPRLCFKNSLNILGPIAGMKIKNQLLLPAPSDVDKSNKGVHLRPYSQTVKKALDAVYKKSLGSTPASPDIPDFRNKCKNNSSRFSYSGELQKTGRSSPFRSSGVSGMSPCRSRTPQSPFRGARSLGFSKESVSNYPERSQSAGRVSRILQQERKIISSSPVVEKTLYIDTISSAEKRHSYTGTLSSKNGREHDIDNIKCLNVYEGRNPMVSEVSGSQSNFPTLKDLPRLRCQLNRSREFKLEKAYNSKDKPSEQMRKSFDENPDMKAIQTFVAQDSENGAGYMEAPLAPPLPKSPPESWLRRTLPLVSLKTSLPYSSQATQSHFKAEDFDTPSVNIKWETLVKTSNSHHDHVRYSEELVTHVSQHQ